MKYKCCKFIQNGINLNLLGIRFCNKLCIGPILTERVDNSKIDFDLIEKKRKETIENCKNDILPEGCDECEWIEDKEWDSTDVITEVEVYNWTHCNCSCVYCSNIETTKGAYTNKIKASEYFDAYPILKNFADKKIINNQTHISFVGGEPTILKEFPKLIDLFLKIKARRISILTSGILYSKAIEKTLKNCDSVVCISIDSGSRETYLKLKRVDKFDEVVKNLKKYKKSVKDTDDKLELKYIIIDGINDNEEEIKKWLDLTKEIGIKRASVSIEFCHSARKKAGIPIPQKYYDLNSFAVEYGTKIGLNTYPFSYFEMLMKKGHY